MMRNAKDAMPSYITALLVLSNEKNGGDVSPLKLIKLAYISHGFHLAIFDEPLVREPVEAWQYGPVIRTLYFAARHFRKRPVPIEVFAHFKDQVDDVLNQEQQDMVNEVIKVYGHYSPLELSSITHKPGSPWDITVKEKGIGEEVSNKDIKTYYKRLQQGGA